MQCSHAHNEKLQVHVIPISHWDVGWLYTTSEYFDLRVKGIIDRMLQYLSEHPETRFHIVEAKFITMWWEQASSEDKRLFLNLMNEKRFEFVLGTWVMPDQALTTYSSVINQATLGHSAIQRIFGKKWVPREGFSIDPFGQSETVPTLLYKLMNFTHHVGARIPYRVKEQMIQDQSLEFWWRGVNGEMFTRILYESYCSPSDWEGAYPWVFNHKEHPAITEENLKNQTELLVQILRKRAESSYTNHLFYPLGCDFEFYEPSWNFGNFSMLMNAINDGDYGMEVKYSLQSEYFDEIKPLIPKEKTFEGDFLVYDDYNVSVWSGFFTSRPLIKIASRVGEQKARMMEMLFASAFHGKQYDPEHVAILNELRGINGEIQHHDAITGTMTVPVLEDYLNRLDIAIKKAEKMTLRSSIPQLVGDYDFTFDWKEQEFRANSQIPYLLFNSLAWERSEFIAFTVPRSFDYTVLHEGRVIPHEIIRLEDDCMQIGFQYRFKATELAVFMLQVHEKRHHWTYEPQTLSKETIISNEYYSLTFDPAMQTFTKLSNLRTNVTILFEPICGYYIAFNGNGSSQSDGAYNLRTDGEVLLQPSHHELRQNQTLVELIQYYKDQPWLTVTTRIYVQKVDRVAPGFDLNDIIEMEYNVGPIPENIEFFARFKTSLLNQKILYTDSNSLQMTKRIYTTVSPLFIAKNYYPTQYFGYIEDIQTQDRLGIASEKSQAISSQSDGSVELLLHRRNTYDDWKGLTNHYLNDTSVIQTKLYLSLSQAKPNIPNYRHGHSYRLNYPIEIIYGRKAVSSPPKPWRLLSKAFPPALHLLNFEIYDPKVLIRVVNIDETSKPVSMDLSTYFTNTTLDGDRFSLNGIHSLGPYHGGPLQFPALHFETLIVENKNN